MRALIIFAIILALIPAANAATIQGSVYDFSLEPASAVVEINTSPVQKKVAKEVYEFDVPAGTYLLTAKKMSGNYTIASVEEEITVPERGFFVRDLILFPDFETDIDIVGPELDYDEFPEETNTNYFGIALILFIASAILYVIGKKKPENPELDADAKAVLDYITKQKRTTQKEIRQEFHHSEAKISLIITELESKDFIRKIRKGRGNVIIRN